MRSLAAAAHLIRISGLRPTMSNPDTKLSPRPIQIAAATSGMLVLFGLLFAYVAYEHTPSIREIRVESSKGSHMESKANYLFAVLAFPTLISIVLSYFAVRWERFSQRIIASFWAYQSQNPDKRSYYLRPLYHSVVFGTLLMAALATGISAYRSAVLLGLWK